MKRFNLPDVGEGLQEAEIVEWKVSAGDLVEADQIILIIETDKANVEIPSPCKGRITKLHGEPGAIIKVGNPLVDFEEGVDVEADPEDTGTVVGKLETGAAFLEESRGGSQRQQPLPRGNRARATPAVRALATRLGVDITSLKPTGPKGSVTKADVEKAAAAKTDPISTELPAAASITPSPVIKGTPLQRAKRSMALNMSRSHSQVALVTLMDDADITHWGEGEDLTVRLVQAIVAACNAEPGLNACYDHENLVVQLFDEVHLGIAVDTVEALYVPVLKNAERADPPQIRNIINQFKGRAREKAFLQEELKGATLILSNFGGIGGRYATPMVVPPMVCIVGVGRTHHECDLLNGQPTRLKKLPLSLSFDHRAVTGGEAARFLTAMIHGLQR